MSNSQAYVWPNLCCGHVITARQGIDYLIVHKDQLTLDLYFLKPVSTELADKSIFSVEGGERIRAINIIDAKTTGTLSVRMKLDRFGDWSPYRLAIADSAWKELDIDPLFSGITFSFKVNCTDEIEMDCRTHLPGTDKFPAIRNFDYQAKDYESFKQAMLDRIPLTLPDWWDRAEADFGIALVDMLAYAGDRLSYFQDRVAAESQFQSAQTKQAIAGHLKLIDYKLDPGETARTYIYFEVDHDTIIPDGTVIETPALSGEIPLVFTLRSPFPAYRDLNVMQIYSFGHPSLVIPAGACRMAVCGEVKGLDKESLIIIEKGNNSAEIIGGALHLVRLSSAPVYKTVPDGSKITFLIWDDACALPWDAPVSVTRILGNISISMHGEAQKLSLYIDGNDDGIVCYTDGELSHINLPAGPLGYSNSEPLITITVDGEPWTCVPSLKESRQYETHYQIVDMDNGQNRVLFGDDVNGYKPERYSFIEIHYHIGLGTSGNVAAGTLTRLRKSDGVELSKPAINYVCNPFCAEGGRDPESGDHAKRWGPKQIRKQERAVTLDDYAREAMSIQGVSRAIARFVWTGSWVTVRITIDPSGTEDLSSELKQSVYEHLMERKLAGYDIQIFPVRYVPLDIKIRCCVEKLSFRDQVYRDLSAALGNETNADGTKGLFHPDNWTFGQGVKLSSLYDAIASVSGVECTDILKFDRLRNSKENRISDIIGMKWDEIARLDNDRNFPEHGRLDLDLYGGR